MRQFRTVFIALTLAAVACSTSQAGVVFGNLGSSGTDGFTNDTTDYGAGLAIEELAIGFTTGTSQETLQSITLGIFAVSSGTENLTVSVYADAGGVPGTALYTSASIPVGGTGSYVYSFSPSVLNANTTYWVVPEGGSDTAWYWGNSTPSAQNGSGFGFAGSKQFVSSAWSDALVLGNPKPYAMSVSVVPEPSAVVLAIGGVVALGLFRLRRRDGVPRR